LKGGVAILQQSNNGFNHGIHEVAQDEKGITAMAQDVTAQPMFQKTLGGTIYTVNVHFSHTSKESFEDKILRMLESEAVDIA